MLKTGLLICGLCFGFGTLLVVDHSVTWMRFIKKNRQRPIVKNYAYLRLAISVVTAIVTFIATGWFVPAVGVGLLINFILSTLFRRDTDSISIIEGLVSWTTLIRDTLKASAGINQALHLACQYAPAQIRQAVSKLSTELKSGYDAEEAFANFRSALNCRSADLISVTLCTAIRGRVANVADLLSVLVEDANQQLEVAREIKAARSVVVSNIRTIILVIVGFSFGMAVLAKSYMLPYHGFYGQTVLVVVCGIYAFGIYLLIRLMRSSIGERVSN